MTISLTRRSQQKSSNTLWRKSILLDKTSSVMWITLQTSILRILNDTPESSQWNEETGINLQDHEWDETSNNTLVYLHWLSVCWFCPPTVTSVVVKSRVMKTLICHLVSVSLFTTSKRVLRGRFYVQSSVIFKSGNKVWRIRMSGNITF